LLSATAAIVGGLLNGALYLVIVAGGAFPAGMPVAQKVSLIGLACWMGIVGVESWRRLLL
jgi:O-antigen ligase